MDPATLAVLAPMVASGQLPASVLLGGVPPVAPATPAMVPAAVAQSAQRSGYANRSFVQAARGGGGSPFLRSCMIIELEDAPGKFFIELDHTPLSRKLCEGSLSAADLRAGSSSTFIACLRDRVQLSDAALAKRFTPAQLKNMPANAPERWFTPGMNYGTLADGTYLKVTAVVEMQPGNGAAAAQRQQEVVPDQEITADGPVDDDAPLPI